MGSWRHVGGHVGVILGSCWGHVGVMLDVTLGSCWRSCWGHPGCHVGIMLGGCFFGVFEGCLTKKPTGPEGKKFPSRKKSAHRSRGGIEEKKKPSRKKSAHRSGGTIEGKKFPSPKKSDHRSRGTSRASIPKSKIVGSPVQWNIECRKFPSRKM